jgi:secreted Zn-dependent insulinase-like peptidase
MSRKVFHGRFLVQSSVKGPDALIQRINKFLIDTREGKIKDLTDLEVETSVKALIKLLEQKDLKLSDEFSRRWVAITDDSGIVDFDKRQKKIAALREVNKEKI